MALTQTKGYLLGIGSNIDPKDNITKIISCLLSYFPYLKLSRVIKTLPVSMNSHNIFLNAVIFIETEVTAAALKTICNHIEVQLGRDRDDPLSTIKDRSADLDILTNVHFPDDYNRPVQHITDESFLYPLLVELLGFLSGRQYTVDKKGVALGTDSLSFGQTATTIHRHTCTSDKSIS